MANIPRSTNHGSSSYSGGGAHADLAMPAIERLVHDICDSNRREHSIAQLAKRKEIFPQLAPMLWDCPMTIAALLQEITKVYPLLSPPTLSLAQSNRICNTLALLQCVAANRGTRGPFLDALVPSYLYPFLNTTERVRPFEYLRLTSLGVIGALVKEENPEAITYFLKSEIIPICLKNLEIGGELSKTVSIFIIKKILLDDAGIDYICKTPETFHSLSRALDGLVTSLVAQPSVRLLKHIIHCYHRLSNNVRSCDFIKYELPPPLRDGTFVQYFLNDSVTRGWLEELLHNLQQRQVTVPHRPLYRPPMM